MKTPQEYYNESRKMTMEEALQRDYHESMMPIQVGILFTEEEVSKLLKTQRENCYVAVYNESSSQTLAGFALTAPEPMGGEWRNK